MNEDPAVELGPVVLVEAIVETRRVVAASLLMWASGYVVGAFRDLPPPLTPADDVERSVWSASIQLLMMALLIAVAFWAPRAARALGLPHASRYWGAWVPCANPFVMVVFSARLWHVMTEFGVGPRLLFATRGRLEIEL